MARISCSRLASEMPESAFTPPKERLIASATSSGPPSTFSFCIKESSNHQGTKAPRRVEGATHPSNPLVSWCLGGSKPYDSARLAERDGLVRGGGEGRDLLDAELRLHHPLAPVLEGDLGLDPAGGGVAVKRVDERVVALADEAAAHLPRPRQLAVVGV